MRTIRMILFGTLFIAVGVGIATFAVQNSGSVTFTFFTFEESYPLFLTLLFAFVCGVLLTGIISLREVFRLEGRVRNFRRQKEMLEREVDTLRNQPLFESPAETETSTLPLRTLETAPAEEESEEEQSPKEIA